MQYTDKKVYEYISRKTHDPILEWKTCRVSGTQFPIYQTDQEFYDKISPTFETSKAIGDRLIAQYPEYFSWNENNKLRVQIPRPTLCPEERQRKRLAFRNERKIYRRKCDFSGKNIISIYSPDKPYKVYDQKIWRSDRWDPMDYGLDLNLQQGFSSFFEKLLLDVPFADKFNPGSENCNYTNLCLNAKDCYLTFVGSFSENTHYSHWALHCRHSLDLYRCSRCEESYQVNGGSKNHNCSYSYDLEQSTNCHRSIGLLGCSDCFLCHNLVNKQYHILNKSYSKEEYFKIIASFSSENIRINYQKIWQTAIRKNLGNYGGENVIGYGNFYGKNLIFCSNLEHAENNKYYDEGARNIANSQDCNYGVETSYNYESISPAQGSYMFMSNTNVGGSYTYYSRYCNNSSYLFGCTNLLNKEYCIYNKQYTKQEWNDFVPQIIAKMIEDKERGEFLDPSLSPFGYNETVAQEYYPLTKEEALKLGYKRSDYDADPVIPENAQVLRPKEIATENRKTWIENDDILRQIIICEVSGRPFILQKSELDFYRKHDLPIPTKHPDVRHEERMKLRPGRILHLRNCDQCDIEMLSVYPVDYEGKVYCEICYQKEMYA